MLVTALCTACFSRAKINKKLWPPYFKIWPPYFECSGAGTASLVLLEVRQRVLKRYWYTATLIA